MNFSFTFFFTRAQSSSMSPLLLRFSSLSRPKRTWNSNQKLLITNQTLVAMESCSSMPELKQIQAQMTRTGLIFHCFPASRVLAFCALSNPPQMHHACLIFAQSPQPNTFMYNTMIRGYTRSTLPSMALLYFIALMREPVEPDARSFVFALKACEKFACVSAGEGVHCLVCKLGFQFDLVVENSLVHFYAEHGRVGCARKVFDGIPQRDVFSWTTMIDVYARSGFGFEAFRTFSLMRTSDVRPNEVTMITVLSACLQIGVLNLGKSVHAIIEKSNLNVTVNLLNALVDMYGKCCCVGSARKVFDGMETKDVFSWTSLLNAYAKSGDLELARQIFDDMPEKNAVSWSSMIAGYSQANQPDEALEMFRAMVAASVEPIDATLVSVLSSCAQTGCLDLGRWIYDHYILEKQIIVGVNLVNAFIDMYAKCGDLSAAAKLFNEMPKRDSVSWNSIITGYAIHGYGEEALSLFEQMKSEGVSPDDITFVGVLSACNHSGLVAKGRKHFEEMKTVFGIEPRAEHYACLIDLLSRVGLLEDVFELVKRMPMEPDAAGWGAILNACRIHGNVELGTCAGDKLLGLDPGDSGIYILLSNLYAGKEKWNEVKKVRRMMRERGVKKTPGFSSIEVDGKFHEFFSADKSHILSEEIYGILDVLYIQFRFKHRQ
ncbi:TPR-like protein [Dioscorea alata]|uniref:TPR-like protein n=1 Tax=Dioscorea alata TaxID=55571 RepID=A0ACB7W0T7_DIOAL|nr:TPR-like protein [Dioscorea alata]